MIEIEDIAFENFLDENFSIVANEEKQTKEEDPEGTISASLYNVAERRLDAIRKEQFFREGVPSKMIINNKEYKAVN